MFIRIIALLLLIFCSPLLLILFVLVKTTSKGPFIFKQLRAGKNRRPFKIYKIRTMVENAEIIKNRYNHLNESDGPTFKIRNDPRYTKIGKILSHSGLDELPQLINIIKDEMAFVGPRPFPIPEANKIDARYIKRFTVLPGITSLWILKKSPKLTFTDWMKIDLYYIDQKSFWFDLSIFLRTLFTIIAWNICRDSKK